VDSEKSSSLGLLNGIAEKEHKMSRNNGKWMILMAILALAFSSVACDDGDKIVSPGATPGARIQEWEKCGMDGCDNIEKLENWIESVPVPELEFEDVAPVISEMVEKAKSGEYTDGAYDTITSVQDTIKDTAYSVDKLNEAAGCEFNQETLRWEGGACTND